MYLFFGRRSSQEHVNNSADRLEWLFAFRRDVIRVFLKVGEYALIFRSESRIRTVAVIGVLRPQCSLDGFLCRGVACYASVSTALGRWRTGASSRPGGCRRCCQQVVQFHSFLSLESTGWT